MHRWEYLCCYRFSFIFNTLNKTRFVYTFFSYLQMCDFHSKRHFNCISFAVASSTSLFITHTKLSLLLFYFSIKSRYCPFAYLWFPISAFRIFHIPNRYESMAVYRFNFLLDENSSWSLGHRYTFPLVKFFHETSFFAEYRKNKIHHKKKLAQKRQHFNWNKRIFFRRNNACRCNGISDRYSLEQKKKEPFMGNRISDRHWYLVVVCSWFDLNLNISLVLFNLFLFHSLCWLWFVSCSQLNHATPLYVHVQN